jgi:hypothetical protein
MEEASLKLTPAERKALAKRSKAWEEASRQIKLSGFLRAPAVWKALSPEDPADFEKWVAEWKCCAPLSGSLCNKPALAFRLENPSAQPAARPYQYVPLCAEHSELAKGNLGAIEGGSHYLDARRLSLVQEWAWKRLCDQVGLLAEMSAPDPAQVTAWAHQHQIAHLLPRSLLNPH